MDGLDTCTSQVYEITHTFPAQNSLKTASIEKSAHIGCYDVPDTVQNAWDEYKIDKSHFNDAPTVDSSVTAAGSGDTSENKCDDELYMELPNTKSFCPVGMKGAKQ